MSCSEQVLGRVARERRGKAFIFCWAVGFLAALLAASAAQAGPTYVLDRARTDVAPITEPGIVEINAGVQTRLPLAPGIPSPNPLTAPVGIDVDETNDLIYMTDSGGYPGNYDFGECGGNDCGAVLRIDPSDFDTTLVSGPSEVPNYLEDPYGLLVLSPTEALVAEKGRVAIVSVDLTDGDQTLFNEKASGSSYPGGLRNPWDVARDPTNGDILVVNNGNAAEPPDTTCVTPQANGFCPNEFDIPVPGDCQSSRGYVMRYDSTGQQKAIYCSTRFAKPRHAAIAADGTIFVTDPFADETDNDGGFGTVFEIDPVSGAVEPLSGGGSFATVSGIDFSVDGSRLLTSDETLFPYGSGGCTGGCGGVVQVNPLGGDQAVTEMREPGGDWIDPIDIAVNRDEAPAPAVTPNATPPYLNLNRPEGAQPTARSLTLVPVRSGTTVTLICIEIGCKDANGRQLKRSYTVPAGASSFTLPLEAFEYSFCTGAYRLLGSRCCPPKTKLKGKKCVPKRRSKKAAAVGNALSAKCRPKKCGKPPLKKYSVDKYRLDLKAPGLNKSRFIDFSVASPTVTLLSPFDCATPSTELDLVAPVGTASCLLP